ncbi:MAG TPA: phosphotransferase family protein [Methylomirabilota bacterium]|nr:phosphotransferase family protein [Methylomirabilota bacterium]
MTRPTDTAPDTAPIRPDENFDVQALDADIRPHLPGVSGPLEVTQFPGGHSNLTYLLRYGEQEFVMRRPPLGPVAPKAHDMGREYRALEALWPVFPPAPRPYCYREDSSVIGAPFYVMERRRGIVIRRELPPQWAHNVGLRGLVSEAMVDVMVALHAVDWRAAGLGDLGRPEGFMQRQVHGWAERWERARDREIPAITELARWLAERVPQPQDATLVHGDLKLDNVMLDPADPSRVVAVLDWEMCTTGDPLADLGLLLCYWADPGDPPARKESVVQLTALPGFYTRDRLVERYAKHTGRDVSRIAFYEVFALYKIAVVVQQIYIRWKRGQTRDERFGLMAPRVEALAQAAMDLAMQSGL